MNIFKILIIVTFVALSEQASVGLVGTLQVIATEKRPRPQTLFENEGAPYPPAQPETEDAPYPPPVDPPTHYGTTTTTTTEPPPPPPPPTTVAPPPITSTEEQETAPPFVPHDIYGIPSTVAPPLVTSTEEPETVPPFVPHNVYGIPPIAIDPTDPPEEVVAPHDPNDCPQLNQQGTLYQLDASFGANAHAEVNVFPQLTILQQAGVAVLSQKANPGNTVHPSASGVENYKFVESGQQQLSVVQTLPPAADHEKTDGAGVSWHVNVPDDQTHVHISSSSTNNGEETVQQVASGVEHYNFVDSQLQGLPVTQTLPPATIRANAELLPPNLW